MWECPIINNRRNFQDLKGIEVASLPKAVANGVPPAMAIGAEGAYWDGTSRSQIITQEGQPLFPPSQQPGNQKIDRNSFTFFDRFWVPK